VKSFLLKISLVIGSFLCGVFHKEITKQFVRIQGETKNCKVKGVTSVDRNGVGMFVYINGIDPKTKLEFRQSLRNNFFAGCMFNCLPKSKIYHDVPTNQTQYATWKENNLYVWEVEVHLHD
jgi:hypothetical protein